jgi:hypothetical protein
MILLDKLINTALWALLIFSIGLMIWAIFDAFATLIGYLNGY